MAGQPGPVATRIFMSRHRLNRLKEVPGRDMVIRSRPGLMKVVSQPHFEVATWFGLEGVAT